MRRSPHAGMLFIYALLTLGLAHWAPGYAAQPSISVENKPMQIEGRVPRSGLITSSPEPIPEGIEEIEMLRDSLGLIDVLEPKAFSAINRIADQIDPDTPIVQYHDTPVYLHIRRGTQSAVLAMHRPDDDTLLILDPAAPQRRWTIRRDVFDRLGINLDQPKPRDMFAATTDALTLELPQPHAESSIVLDPGTVRSRIRQNFPRLTRVLGEENFRVRLPSNYDPTAPAGILVWISPNENGRIPTIFEPICDELGLIAIGVDNNGNQREITDRLQNHLDSIETLAQHANIDRQRIYLTGMSGGGRCSGILQLAFPDHFAGAVPIVGLDTYHNAPTGNGNQYWPKRVGKPSGANLRRLKERRIRSITGTADFNEPEMTRRTTLLQEDGIDAQIDVVEGMAHTMPSPEQFSTALRWVDERRRQTMEDAKQQAEAILRETRDLDPAVPAVRRRLIEAMQLLPYSDLAWQAAQRLGYTQPE
ncbi:MAG: hypothetical protein ACF8MF_08150 [Phycisphaerales bacterium JB052]